MSATSDVMVTMNLLTIALVGCGSDRSNMAMARRMYPELSAKQRRTLVNACTEYLAENRTRPATPTEDQ